MSKLVVEVPAEHRTGTGTCPAGPLTVVSLWAMGDDKIGVWLRQEGSDRVYPVTDVTREQVLSWQVE